MGDAFLFNREKSPASMKVPTRRWGNALDDIGSRELARRLNESPHPKVGKYGTYRQEVEHQPCLNESPHPKVGK